MVDEEALLAASDFPIPPQDAQGAQLGFEKQGVLLAATVELKKIPLWESGPQASLFSFHVVFGRRRSSSGVMV